MINCQNKKCDKCTDCKCTTKKLKKQIAQLNLFLSKRIHYTNAYNKDSDTVITIIGNCSWNYQK